MVQSCSLSLIRFPKASARYKIIAVLILISFILYCKMSLKFTCIKLILTLVILVKAGLQKTSYKIKIFDLLAFLVGVSLFLDVFEFFLPHLLL